MKRITSIPLYHLLNKKGQVPCSLTDTFFQGSNPPSPNYRITQKKKKKREEIIHLRRRNSSAHDFFSCSKTLMQLVFESNITTMF